MMHRRFGRVLRVVSDSPRPPLSPRRRALRTLVALAALGTLPIAAGLNATACQPAPISSLVHSLVSSGRVSFVCLDRPGLGADKVHLPLSACNGAQVSSNGEYLYMDDAGTVDAGVEVPHLYALVTQTLTGEVAVVDTTSYTTSVLDNDPRKPGANLLPVGAQPIDIVSTPGGSATFVGVGEVKHPGIYALPSGKIRSQASRAVKGAYVGSPPVGSGGNGGAGGAGQVPQLTSWPSCSLPAAPGDMLLVPDFTHSDSTTCDGSPVASTASSDPDEQWTEAKEGTGSQKLVVAIPDLGAIAVFDAREIYESKPGEFAPCRVERWVKLKADVSGLQKTQPKPTGPACSNPPDVTPSLKDSYTPRPAGLAYADGKLYVADRQAPVIHVVDMPTPCNPVEVEPLLPTSIEKPDRVVFTDRIAVAPTPTPEFKRYLYAVDAEDVDFTAMVFDVGSTATTRRPLLRAHPEWNPFMPRDRVRFPAKAADIKIVTHDIAAVHPASGVAVEGIRCDPSSQASMCPPGQPSFLCSVATLYQPKLATATGASPSKLRGQFAFAALTNGKVSVIDIDDFDAPCRVPSSVASPDYYNAESGCPKSVPGGGDTSSASNEISCNIVLPNAPRSLYYEARDDTTGNHVPGIEAAPLLYNFDGSLADATLSTTPRMMATVGKDASSATLFVANVLTNMSDDKAPGYVDRRNTFTLAMNLEDPRAQVVNQNWSVTYEGVIPGFDQRFASVQLKSPANGAVDTVTDPDSKFCQAGVLGANANEELAIGDGLSTTDAKKAGEARADYVQILTEVLDQGNYYWQQADGGPVAAADGTTCTWTTCDRAFPTTTMTPIDPKRDLRIIEAYQDHLDVEPRTPGITMGMVKCCFPSGIQFAVRGGSQWIVTGDQSGFLHHVVPDAATGKCRNRCDPLSRMNGRAFPVPYADYVNNPSPDPQKGMFINPMFRFTMVDGAQPDATPATGDTGDAGTVGDAGDAGESTDSDTVNTGTSSTDIARDRVFRFTTMGSFTPLVVNLTTDGTAQIAPRALSYVPSTGELVVTDGNWFGVIFVSLGNAAVSRSYY